VKIKNITEIMLIWWRFRRN